jgi:16S rRNA C967 or C1407 C5-methylase (RsmB/RsmF family)/NOL1/NOP2/fmu family ribosome biogenesis protein
MPNIPEQLLNTLCKLDHFEAVPFVEAHHENNRITSVRLNPFKKTTLDFELGKPVSWSGSGYYLASRPSFTYDPLFHAGCYYVQEAGSMFLESALVQTLDRAKSLRILDACAAPGGKSTLINSFLKEQDLLVSNEIIRSRAGVLTENLGRWGTCNTVVTNNEVSKFSDLEGFFDAIVVDAPCSGSGLFRKQPEAIDEWSPAAVVACSVRQKKILTELYPALKTGGILYYSTCSYSPEENEDIVSWLINDLGMSLLPLQLPENSGIVDSGLGYRFYPHLTESEGFFIAVLRKEKITDKMYVGPTKTDEAAKTEMAILNNFAKIQDGRVVKKNNHFHLMNEQAVSFFSAFAKHLYFRKAGTVLGEIKGVDLVPNQELAWSVMKSENCERTDLSYDDAIRYLKKENLLIPLPGKGLRLITYKEQGIGWAKILPNRLNNYLPAEYRILK